MDVCKSCSCSFALTPLSVCVCVCVCACVPMYFKYSDDNQNHKQSSRILTTILFSNTACRNSSCVANQYTDWERITSLYHNSNSRSVEYFIKHHAEYLKLLSIRQMYYTSSHCMRITMHSHGVNVKCMPTVFIIMCSHSDYHNAPSWCKLSVKHSSYKIQFL